MMSAAANFSSTAVHHHSIHQDQQTLYIAICCNYKEHLFAAVCSTTNLRQFRACFARRLLFDYTALLHMMNIPSPVRLIAQGFPCRRTRCLPCPQTSCPPPVEGRCSAHRACMHKKIQAPVCQRIGGYRVIPVLIVTPVS